MRKEGFEYDHVFDWVMIVPQNAGSSGLNFSVESFDEIKQANRKKTKSAITQESVNPSKEEKQTEDEHKQTDPEPKIQPTPEDMNLPPAVVDEEMELKSTKRGGEEQPENSLNPIIEEKKALISRFGVLDNKP
jgi:hypothetical protein